jgi:hypothetical protein
VNRDHSGYGVIRLAELWRFDENARRERRLMIFKVFHAYMDESGTHDQSKVVAVAGYLATYEQWTAFEKEFNQVMDHFAVKDFHMTYFESRHGEFDWKNYWFSPWAEDTRTRLIERVTTLCQRHTIIGLGCAVVREQYERLLPQEMRDELRHPYYFCIYACLSMLLRWNNPKLETLKPINFLFDQKKGRFHLGSAMVSWEAFVQELYQRVKAGLDPEGKILGQAVPGGDRKEYPQLRAADLIVFETARLRLHQLEEPERPIRKSMDVLRKDLNLLVTFLTEVRLRNFVRIMEGAASGLNEAQIRASLETDDPEGEEMRARE